MFLDDIFSMRRRGRFHLIHFLLYRLALEHESRVSSLELFDLRLQTLALVHAVLEVTQEHVVAQQPALLLQSRIVHSQRVFRLFYFVQHVSTLKNQVFIIKNIQIFRL